MKKKNKAFVIIKFFRKLILSVFILLLTVFLVTLFINIYVVLSVKDNILSEKEAAALEDVDCILVLGCSVKSDNTPSKMLADRLDKAIELYNNDTSRIILMSGDHKTDYYNEVMVMKNYAISHGVPSENIFIDHAGYCTYDSMYRAKEIYGVEKMVVVTQKYHLYRALWIAEKMDIEVYGVAAKEVDYNGQLKRDVRETGARVKDFFECIFMNEAEYMGEKIPLTGSGDVTNEKN